MVHLITICLVALHLLAVNYAGAGPLLAAWLLATRQGEVECFQRRLGRRVARGSLAALGVGIVLGALLLVPSNGPLRDAVARFPTSAYWFAGAELAFSAACGAALIVFANAPRRRPIAVWILALASSTNLLYHFPPLMIVVGKLGADPEWASERVIYRPALLHLAARPEVLSLWIHFVLASIAVASALALWPNRAADGGEDSPGAAQAFGRLAGTGLAASILQVPVGLWILAAAPDSMRTSLMGESLLASATFLAGLLAALQMAKALAAVAWGECGASLRRRAVLWTVIVTVFMTATLSLSKTGDGADRAELTSRRPPAPASHPPANRPATSPL